jgi:hypothetical protein
MALLTVPREKGSGWREVRLVMCFSDEKLKLRGRDKNGEPRYSILEKKYTPWAESLLSLLKNGRADEALENLKEYEGKKIKDGVVNPHTYLTNNRNKVDYPAYKNQSLYIDSGPIESGNKVVVQRRCKQSGMRWNVPTLQSM